MEKQKLVIKKHYILAIILALSLLLVVFASTPG